MSDDSVMVADVIVDEWVFLSDLDEWKISQKIIIRNFAVNMMDNKKETVRIEKTEEKCVLIIISFLWHVPGSLGERTRPLPLYSITQQKDPKYVPVYFTHYIIQTFFSLNYYYTQ